MRLVEFVMRKAMRVATEVKVTKFKTICPYPKKKKKTKKKVNKTIFPTKKYVQSTLHSIL
jgi:hypothetical protein